MTSRKHRNKVIDEGPFLFSEEEMNGMIQNVTVIETPFTGNVEKPLNDTVEPHIETESEQESVPVHETTQQTEGQSNDERIVEAMTNVLGQMRYIDMNKIRLIAISIAVMCQQGLDLNRRYSVPLIQASDLTGYELAAWCYCSFMSAFPSMQDKLRMPYAEHYAKAKESFV